MKIIRTHSSTLLSFITGVVSHHYIGKLLDYKNDMESSKEQSIRDEAVNQNFQTVINHLKNIEKNQNNNTESLNELVEKNTSIPTIEIETVSKKIEKGSEWCEKVLKYFNDNQDSTVNIEVYKEAFKKAQNCANITQEAQKSVNDLISKYGGSNNFISNFNINDFYNYLNSLNLLELSALFHILILSMLLISLFNISSSLFANEIIKYFNLEEKHPKLNKIFQLRLKFQKYYLSLHLFIIFIICIITIFINLIVLY